jgi:hypothetical protein
MVHNFWLDRKVDAVPTLNRVGIRRLMVHVKQRIHFFWEEDASTHTFSSKVKDLMNQLRRRGAFCEYSLNFYEKKILVGIQMTEKTTWAYLEQELA